jgi:hypothetical protein
MKLYHIEIKYLGSIIKVVGIHARNALDACNDIGRPYPIGPFEFCAREVVVNA